MTRLLAATMLLLALCLLAVTPEFAYGHYRPGLHNTRHAINESWCGRANSYCRSGDQAWRVARCESGGTFSPWAANGRYLGMFQVSDHWRRTVPGFRFNNWAQARHAHRVYVLTGGWSHWSCAYIVGIL